MDDWEVGPRPPEIAGMQCHGQIDWLEGHGGEISPKFQEED